MRGNLQGQIAIEFACFLVLLNSGFSICRFNAVCCLQDISTAQEKALGALVKEKHGTDFFIMDRFPMEVPPDSQTKQPTMPL